MNLQDSPSVDEVSKKVQERIEKWAVERDGTAFWNDYFCKNAVYILIHAGNLYWADVVRSLSAEIKSTLVAFCREAIATDYAPPAEIFLTGLPTDEQLREKRAELQRDFRALAQVIIELSTSG